ncbi:MAG: hypothetical protein KAU14_04940 [Thermoplasmata archaeon]|nr:hypothetical protein [Thermoplasmata archaeon]
MSSIRALGAVFLVLALVSVIVFFALAPEEERREYRDSFSLDGKSGSDKRFRAEEDSELEFNFNSDPGIDVYLLNDEGGLNITIAKDSSGTYFDRRLSGDGEYTIRFVNNRDEVSAVNYYFVIKNEEDEGPRPVCGILAIVFLVLGIIFISRKRREKIAQIIPAYSSARAPPQAPPSFAPPPGEQPPIPSPTPHLAIDRPPQASFQFTCPDCGTAIFINRKIKKVVCPKCSHSFRIQKGR